MGSELCRYGCGKVMQRKAMKEHAEWCSALRSMTARFPLCDGHCKNCPLGYDERDHVRPPSLDSRCPSRICARCPPARVYVAHPSSRGVWLSCGACALCAC